MKTNIPILALTFIVGVTAGVYFKPENIVVKEVTVERDLILDGQDAEHEDLTLGTEERIQSIAREVREKREKLRVEREATFSKGIVYQPYGYELGDSTVVLKTTSYRDKKLGFVAPLYGLITGKEVMVSGKIANIRINMNHDKNEIDDLQAEFEETFRKHGIKVTHINDSCVALSKF